MILLVKAAAGVLERARGLTGLVLSPREDKIIKP